MDYQSLILDKQDHIAKITLNRPEKLNALSGELLTELDDCCQAIEADHDIHVVLLTGSGRAFSSGFDLTPRDMGEHPPVTSMWYWSHQAPQQLLRFHWLRQPTIAAVNGYALAAGNVLALSCDIVIASEEAQFGEPEIRHVAHSPFTFMPYLIPAKHANWLYLSGETIDARTAERIGLVNKVVPAAQLEEVAYRAAETLAQIPPFAAQHMKRSINQTLDKMGYREAFEHHLVMRDYESLLPDVPERDELTRIRMEQGLRGFLQQRDSFFRDRRLYEP